MSIAYFRAHGRTELVETEPKEETIRLIVYKDEPKSLRWPSLAYKFTDADRASWVRAIHDNGLCCQFTTLEEWRRCERASGGWEYGELEPIP